MVMCATTASQRRKLSPMIIHSKADQIMALALAKLSYDGISLSNRSPELDRSKFSIRLFWFDDSFANQKQCLTIQWCTRWIA